VDFPSRTTGFDQYGWVLMLNLNDSPEHCIFRTAPAPGRKHTSTRDPSRVFHWLVSHGPFER